MFPQVQWRFQNICALTRQVGIPIIKHDIMDPYINKRDSETRAQELRRIRFSGEEAIGCGQGCFFPLGGGAQFLWEPKKCFTHVPTVMGRRCFGLCATHSLRTAHPRSGAKRRKTMKLEIGKFMVKDIVFGYKTAYANGVLTVD